jgi:topoisomerase-4 subunit B
MYTRTQDPTHIVQEVIDNAADEILAGFGKRIKVCLFEDGSVSVEDDGRGIPVGIHPEEGESTLQVVFTRLHAGGKFDKKSGSGAYSFAGGLHGVGVSVTNALSERLEVQVKRQGQLFAMVFSQGMVIQPLSVLGKRPLKETGTWVRVWPEKRFFDVGHVSVNELERILRSKAVLLPGVEILWCQEQKGQWLEKKWHYPEGIKSYLEELTDHEEPLIPIWTAERSVENGNPEGFTDGEGAQWALSWWEEGGGLGESYVNLIATAAGGTHEAGLRQGLFEALKAFIDHHGLLPRAVRVQSEDVAQRLRYVLSVRLVDPQFQGQTKEKLTNRDALKLVAAIIRDPFELWLNRHPEQGKLLADLVIRQAMARMRSSQKIEKKKSSGVAVLPGKLTDCESDSRQERELFLVEGDSAGGSAKMARNKHTQAILPLRGKVLNTFEVDRDRLFANQEVHDIAVALGVDPHGMTDEPDLNGLRYGRIIIMSDADVDGSHIKVLLLTLFYTHFPKLIEKGHICVASPPLYRIDLSLQGKKPARKWYALDDLELNQCIEKARKDGYSSKNIMVGRFKGLGEMNPEQLWDTTMNPETRRVLVVAQNGRGHEEMNKVFSRLMAKGSASDRRSWMEENGHSVEVDI